MMVELAALSQPPAAFDPAPIVPPPLRDREWPVTSLALDVSGRCNIACRYCAESATQPHHRAGMTPATLEASLALLARHGRPGSARTLRLGSGEPLLARPLLRELDRRLKQGREAGDDAPQVFLTTNGTLIDEGTADWLATTGWQVKVSLDGPRSIHDRWRVTAKGTGTWERVANAVLLLAARMPERLSVTAVLCRGNDPAEVFDAIASLGVRRIELVPAVHRATELVPDDRDIERYVDLLGKWVGDRVATPWRRLAAEPIRLVGAVRRVMGYDVKRVVCGAGRNFFGVDARGTLFPCFRFIGMEDYRLGSLSAGLDPAATDAFRSGPARPLEARHACRTCWAATLCGGPCFACSEMFGPGEGEPLRIHCAYALADAHAAVELVNRLRARHPEALLQFLPDVIDR